MSRTTFNLLRDDVEDVAEGVKLRLIANNATVSLYVRQNGDVVTERTYDNRRSRDLPDSELVGVFTRKVPTEQIEEDLIAHAGRACARGTVGRMNPGDLSTIDCTGITIGNDDLAESCAWVPPTPQLAPLPIYPLPEDLPHAA